MTTANRNHQQIAKVIMAKWDAFVAKSNEEGQRIGDALRSLLETGNKFIANDGDWVCAEQCYTLGFQMFQSEMMDSSPKERMTAVDKDFNFRRAATEFHLGTVYLGQSKLDTAIDYYRVSCRDFTYGTSIVGNSLAWWALGKVYETQRNWGKALYAFQRGLSALESARDPRKEELGKLVTGEIHSLRDQLETDLRARHIVTADRKKSDGETGAKVRRLPVLARIAAGTPLPVMETELFEMPDENEILDVLTLDVEHCKGALFGLRVEGDSMVEGGIFDRDFALIRPQPVADNGEIAVVRIVPSADDSVATLKKFFQEIDHCRLEPMNADHRAIVVIPRKEDRERIENDYIRRGIRPDIRSNASVEIVGKVVAIWRRLQT